VPVSFFTGNTCERVRQFWHSRS